MKQYNPHSHFFTDLSSLAAASGNDGFGPVTGSLTTKYRVTSKVKAINATSAKLYAICDGRMLIQPSTDNNKINIIIKPTTNNYSPLKIKYFIYRGVNKADYFTNNVLNQPDVNKPITVTKLWTSLLAFNSLTSPSGNIFPLDYIYDFAAPGTQLIDDAFQKSLVSCIEGDYIGNFNDEVGLDIVLDDGEYTFENQEILFSYNLDFARAQEFIFDTGSLSDTNKKRLKENIHQFLDAAAFWGSHINCGIIKYKDGTTVSNIDSISEILKKYQTGNKLYIYIRENNRSFNYYDSVRKIYGFTSNGEYNKTNDWPILIKESTTDKNLLIEYHIDNNTGTTDNNINEKERQVSLEFISGKGSYLLKKNGAKDLLWSKGKFESYDLGIKISATVSLKAGQTLPAGLQLIDTDANPGKIMGVPQQTGVYRVVIVINDNNILKEENLTFYIDAIDILMKVNLDVSTNKAVADFLFINCDMQQKFPVKNYYDYLWIANIKSSIAFAPSIAMHSASYSKNRNINLNDTIGENAILDNKVIFDKGRTKIGSSWNTKNRRLYVASIKRNTGFSYDLDTLNIDKVSSNFANELKDKNAYFSNIFNDIDFSIYKGTFKDGSKTIKSLSIFNRVSLIRKYSYMLLGITEDEYLKFTLPFDGDNAFFNLVEESCTDKVARKFKLGLRYEASNGTIQIIYPTTGNVYVYSIDDLFFFSEDFSEYQEFYNELAPVNVYFRTVPTFLNPNPLLLPPYNGEFGFDWLRNGDNYYKSGATIIPDVDFYKGITNGYERPKSITGNSEYGSKDTAYKFLTRQYLCIATTPFTTTDLGIYSTSYLTLFSEDFKNKFINSADVDGYTPPLPPYEATLRILVRNTNKTGTIKFVCEEIGLVKFDKQTIVDLRDNTKKEISLTIKITCLKDSSQPINIKALYFPTGVDISNENNAQLAGLIILNKNDQAARKDLNTVLVNCRTDITSNGTGEYIKFSGDDKKRLYEIFHQALILPKLDVIDLALNLSDSKYDKFRVNTPDTFVYITSTTPQRKALNTDRYLKEFEFLANELPSQYAKSLKLYSFELYGRSPTGSVGNTAGIAGGIGKKQAIVFLSHNFTTVPHEGLHSLSLYHAHQDKDTSSLIKITDPDQKFVFIHNDDAIDHTESTDNVMSYTLTRTNLWNWQTKILQKFLE